MPDQPPLRRRLAPGLLLVAVLAAVGVGIWFATRPVPNSPQPPDEGLRPDPPTPDPRLVFDTPFRNVKPNVGYVGDEACAKCHRAINESYHGHPMGRSAEFVGKGAGIERYHATGHTTFASGPFDLEVDTSGKGVIHRIRLREPASVAIPEVAIPAEIAIGSGTARPVVPDCGRQVRSGKLR